MRSHHAVLRVLLAVLSLSPLSDERVESIQPWFTISFLPVYRFKRNASQLSVFTLFWLEDVIGDVPPLVLSQEANGASMPAYFRFLTILAFHVFLQEKVCKAV